MSEPTATAPHSGQDRITDSAARRITPRMDYEATTAILDAMSAEELAQELVHQLRDIATEDGVRHVLRSYVTNAIASGDGVFS